MACGWGGSYFDWSGMLLLHCHSDSYFDWLGVFLWHVFRGGFEDENKAQFCGTKLWVKNKQYHVVSDFLRMGLCCVAKIA